MAAAAGAYRNGFDEVNYNYNFDLDVHTDGSANAEPSLSSSSDTDFVYVQPWYTLNPWAAHASNEAGGTESILNAFDTFWHLAGPAVKISRDLTTVQAAEAVVAKNQHLQQILIEAAKETATAMQVERDNAANDLTNPNRTRIVPGEGAGGVFIDIALEKRIWYPGGVDSPHIDLNAVIGGNVVVNSDGQLDWSQGFWPTTGGAIVNAPPSGIVEPLSWFRRKGDELWAAIATRQGGGVRDGVIDMAFVIEKRMN